MIIDEKLNWNENTVSVYKKCRQRLHFLLKLSKSEVSQSVLSTFYQAVVLSTFCQAVVLSTFYQAVVLSTFHQAVVQSVLLYCFLCNHSSLSAKNMNKLEHVVKHAAKSIHVTPLRSLHCHYMTKKTENILRSATHPLHTTFIPARSGRRYLSISARTAHYSRSSGPLSLTHDC